MALTHSAVAVADYIKTKLDTNITSLGLKHNYYGETNLEPTFPCTIVEPAGKARSMSGRSNLGGIRKWGIDLNVAITVLYAKLEDGEVSVHAIDGLVEQIEDLIDLDITLGGLVVKGWCSSVTPGLRRSPNAFYKASRILWTGESEEIF